ncbi:MAG TPA: hypothetical protein DFS52_27920 [Myxococcales bacterium]|jgi:hypothetical protein|nr:hypothetical protein [Myxococcales bacterium]
MKQLVLALGAALILMPALAQAQIEEEIEQIEIEENQIQVGLNGGIGGFLGQVNDFANTGPAYGVTASASEGGDLISYEAAFMGHTNGLENIDSNITRNQLQAAVKVGPELEAPVMWRPYAFGGVGAALTTVGDNPYGLTNAVEGLVPFGVGADFFTDSTFRVGIRGQYTWSVLGSDVADFAEHPDALSGTLNVSAAF